LIRSAVDTEFFRPPDRRPPSPALRVVTVGRLRWVKGHELALEAIRRLADGEVPVELEMLGDGPDRERVRYAIQDMGLEDRVRMHGMGTPGEVRRRLQRADVLLHPSLSEGGGPPTVVLEAMACGLPVVVTDCGGVCEGVRDGIHGLVVAPRDARGMALALRRLAGDPDLRERMGRAGRALVEADFQLTSQTDELMALYGHVGARPERLPA
jgi:glycosyltransferase involved in cell wall biosynthesis